MSSVEPPAETFHRLVRAREYLAHSAKNTTGLSARQAARTRLNHCDELIGRVLAKIGIPKFICMYRSAPVLPRFRVPIAAHNTQSQASLQRGERYVCIDGEAADTASAFNLCTTHGPYIFTMDEVQRPLCPCPTEAHGCSLASMQSQKRRKKSLLPRPPTRVVIPKEPQRLRPAVATAMPQEAAPLDPEAEASWEEAFRALPDLAAPTGDDSNAEDPAWEAHERKREAQMPATRQLILDGMRPWERKEFLRVEREQELKEEELLARREMGSGFEDLDTIQYVD
ncbi:hypothetical protein C8F04DRAFT_1261939 [Mycena alexandri]|uniref:Uncharacterized protein n=1 Tax=Mycena alexandri TaxID=1745969 RepID=A0AAD6SR94_9AGAR|nr:hypothetical protein C8F04DRAFT_1261939 [Mycena alexandri]